MNMVTLTLAQTERVVEAAFVHWLNHNPNSFNVQIDEYDVRVNIEFRDGRFDCGTPGYNMANSNVDGLEQWVPSHIRAGGNIGGLAPCKMVGETGQVNVILRAFVMFNFHVNLTGPC
jgi:hypothetical protein